MRITLLLKEIVDSYVRENFKRLNEALTQEAVLKAGFSFLDITVPTPTTTVSNFRFPHSLGYTPKDILLTSAIGSGTVTWNYSRFDSEELDLSVSGATAGGTLKLRVFLGAYA